MAHRLTPDLGVELAYVDPRDWSGKSEHEKQQQKAWLTAVACARLNPSHESPPGLAYPKLFRYCTYSVSYRDPDPAIAALQLFYTLPFNQCCGGRKSVRMLSTQHLISQPHTFYHEFNGFHVSALPFYSKGKIVHTG
jgi:hypothetical protein